MCVYACVYVGPCVWRMPVTRMCVLYKGHPVVLELGNRVGLVLFLHKRLAVECEEPK